MSYEVTATRKRPQGFYQLVGQDFVVSTLKSSLKLQRIAHAYIFSGPRGVGKTSAARILAKALNCEQGPTEEPCGKCSQCLEIARGNALDVIEIDGASNTSVNDIRELKDEVLFAPSNGRYKVYIIDEVHMLSNSAFNALLKTIEEPPPYIVFIFATTEIHKVPATIRSRCQQFNFRLIPVERIRDQLRTVVEEMKIEAEDEALFWIAKEATGSLRDAYTLFDQIASFSDSRISLRGIQEKLGLTGIDSMGELITFLTQGETGGAMEKTEEILSQGVSIEQFIIDLTEYFRTLLLLKNGIERESLLGYNPDRFPMEIRNAFTTSQIEYAVEQLLSVYRDIRYSLNQRFELELTLSKLSSLSSRVEPEELVARIRELRAEVLGHPRSSAGPEINTPAFARNLQGAQKKSPELDLQTGAGSFSAPESDEAVQKDSKPDLSASAAVQEQRLRPMEEEKTEPDIPEVSDRGTSGTPMNGLRDDSPRELSSDEIRNIITEVRQLPSLVSTLEKVVEWFLDIPKLRLSCDTNYSLSKLRKDMPMLRTSAQKVLGTSLEIVLIVHDNEGDDGQAQSRRDSQVDLVKKVFRGKIVDGAEHESNGSF